MASPCDIHYEDKLDESDAEMVSKNEISGLRVWLET